MGAIIVMVGSCSDELLRGIAVLIDVDREGRKRPVQGSVGNNVMLDIPNIMPN